MTPNPTYETVCAGDGHTEAIRVEFDPSRVTYDELLDVFHSQCSSSLNERSVQYKAAIWTHDESQQQQAVAKMHKHNRTLDIVKAQPWYDAEESHQKYKEKNCPTQ
eukprot:TRINITY_DN59451_c0_g1_i1.p2 TRINITY_DN59451_c0_g1~~TRINITY_DN59451_c0_g1_i1.p2  ORF type:complete len:106 (-),score=31.19 TRINITY_DN59451_c0_g1_i1:59-376(-)